MSNPRLQVDIGASIAGFQKAMGQVESRLRSVSSNVATIGKQISIGLTAPITAFGVTSVAAFDTQAQAEGRLRAALQANGREVDSLFSKYTEFASQLQQISTTGDEATLAMLATAESMGLTGDAAIRAVQNALSMEAAFGVSAQSAIRMTSALEQGDAQLLTRYIPALRQTEDQAERVAIAQDILGNAFGQVTVQAQTGLGPLKQAQNAFGDLQEQIGSIIAEAINPFLERAKVLFETLQQQPEEVKRRFTIMAGVIAGIGPLLLGIAVAIKAVAFAFGVLSSPLFLITAGMIALGLLIDYLIQNVEALKVRFKNAFQEMQQVVLTSLSSMAMSIGSFVSTLTLGLGTAFIGLGNSLTQAATSIETQTGPAFQTLGEYTSGLSERVQTLATNLKDAVMQALGFVQVAQQVEAAFAPDPESGGAQDETLGFLDRLLESMRANADVAKNYVNTMIDGFAQMIMNGMKFRDALREIGKQLATKAFAAVLKLFLTGGLSAAGTGFFGSGGGLLGSILPGIFGGGAAPVMGASPVSREAMALTGQFTVSGQDLQLVLDRANQFTTR